MVKESFTRRTVLAFGPGFWPPGWVAGSPRYHLFGLAGAGYEVAYVEPPQGRWRARGALRRMRDARDRRGTPKAGLFPPGTIDSWEDRPLCVYHPKTRFFFHPRLPLPVAFLPAYNRQVLARLAREAFATFRKSNLGHFQSPDLLWLGAYHHAPLLDKVPHRRSACFLYDDLPASPAWSGRRARLVGELEEALLRRVDLAIVTSQVLLESRRGLCRRALLLENAVGEEFFEETLPPRPRAGEGSGVLEAVEALGRPRIGYVGALNLRLDVPICEALARAAGTRSWQLVFAGGMDWLYSWRIRGLGSQPSVHLPGWVPPGEVPHLLRLFDVLVLPHVVTPFTRAMFPEKLPEYLATGRPIVSTRLPEVVRVTEGTPGAVEFADTPEGFVEACARALEREDPAKATARTALARHHTRAQRLQTLLATLNELLS